MRNYFTYILILYFGLLAFSANSQTTASTFNDKIQKLSQDSNKLYFLVAESFPAHANGTVFLNEKWAEGTVTSTSNDQFKIPLRYRVYKEEMQVQHNGKTKVLQTHQIKRIELNDMVFVASYFLLKGEKFMSFFELVSDGKLQLLVQYESKEKKGNRTIHTCFYSKRGKASAEKLSSKKSGILNLMQDKKGQVQEFIIKNKIKFKQADDFQKVFDYYNSL